MIVCPYRRTIIVILENIKQNYMKRYFYLFISFFIGVLTLGAQNFPEDGATYRLLNTFRTGVILTEDYGQSFLFCKSPVENDYSQLWRFTKDGDGWNRPGEETPRLPDVPRPRGSGQPGAAGPFSPDNPDPGTCMQSPPGPLNCPAQP